MPVLRSQIDGRFALIGDADGGDFFRREFRPAQRLDGNADLRRPDFLGIVLDPAGLGKRLGKLLIGHREDVPLAIEDNRAGTRRAFVAEQRHEGDVLSLLLGVVGLAPADDPKPLLAAPADRHDEPSAHGQLRQQGLGHRFGSGRHEDPVVGRGRGITVGPVESLDGDVVEAQGRQQSRRAPGELVDALQRVDAPDEPGQHGRLVAGPEPISRTLWPGSTPRRCVMTPTT